jgi:hypothetical protein
MPLLLSSEEYDVHEDPLYCVLTFRGPPLKQVGGSSGLVSELASSICAMGAFAYSHIYLPPLQMVRRCCSVSFNGSKFRLVIVVVTTNFKW